MGKEKFKFDLDFQWAILKYTIRDKYGYKAISLYKPEYFDLVHQQVVAKAIQRFFKRKKRVPASAHILNEELNSLFRTKDYAQSLLEKDREVIKLKVKRLYKGLAKDGDEILHRCKLFASYVEFKRSLEDIDLENFSSYESYSKKIQKAINLGMEVDEKQGRFLVAGHQNRITERYNTDDIIPTPFRQINKLTNANGYTKGSIIVVIDRPKKGKTEFLVNVAASLIKQRSNFTRQGRNVAYIDLENGEVAIEARLDQCIMNKSKMEILSHEHDDKLKKMFRQLRRFQGEVYVRRMPWGTTADQIQKVLDDVYQEYGIKFDDLIIDYAALMGSNAGTKEDFQRISEVYLDLKNLGSVNSINAIYTAHHIKREAYKRRLTKYEPDDLAKCIDIERHVDAIFGLQQSKLEEQSKVMRLELITQRDGVPYGRALFWENVKTQRLTEFTKEEEAKYSEELEKLGHEDRVESDSERDTRERKQKKVRSDI